MHAQRPTRSALAEFLQDFFNLYTKGKPNNKQKLGSNQSTKPTTENLPFWQASGQKPLRES